jgi:hypothetical protein
MVPIGTEQRSNADGYLGIPWLRGVCVRGLVVKMEHALGIALMRPLLALVLYGIAAAIAIALRSVLRRVLPPRLVEFLYRKR